MSVDTILKVPEQGHECEMWSAGVIFAQFLFQKIYIFQEIRVMNEEKSDIKYDCFFLMELAQMFGTRAVS